MKQQQGSGPITSSTVFHSLKAMQDVHLCMYVCMFACVYNFHSETQVPLLLFRRSTRSNPPSMFFECQRRG